MEDCLEVESLGGDDDNGHHYLRPLDYHDYMYDYDDIGSVSPERPPSESSFGSVPNQNAFNPSNTVVRPGDSVVTRPVFTADGQLLFEAEQTKSEQKLDRLISSLGSLINLLNSTRDEGN